jgi:hypothetical protein
MTILPGLTSTRKERIPAFLEAMERHGVRRIALFPTCLVPRERAALYTELGRLPGLSIPHVHLRSDADAAELDLLHGRFGTKAFNIHPAASVHPFTTIPPRHAKRIFVENVEELPEAAELAGLGGLCPDYSHWENARLQGRVHHDQGMRQLAASHTIGCCHLSAIRLGVPNAWAGEWDHHAFATLDDFSFLVRYRAFMPARWASLELENPLEEQLAAARHIAALLS